MDGIHYIKIDPAQTDPVYPMKKAESDSNLFIFHVHFLNFFLSFLRKKGGQKFAFCYNRNITIRDIIISEMEKIG